ncbi:hypothetical protein TNCV_1583471 [Trichonephila clavipes]|nr:hypothetical protein TNCV_1583471 [Trichonephila clavipes]
MDVCKCIVPLRHGGTLNSRRAASPLMRLVEGEERWEPPYPPSGCSPSKLGWSSPVDGEYSRKPLSRHGVIMENGVPVQMPILSSNSGVPNPNRLVGHVKIY